MSSKPHAPFEPRNRLLARLPESTRRRLGPLLRPVELTYDQLLYEANGPIRYAYFPEGAILSALTVMRDGSVIEVATVGHEGLVGHHAFGGEISPHRVVVQLGGGSHRLVARDLQAVAAEDDSLRELLAAYHLAFMIQVSQSVACNGLHRLEQRCCRWLLMGRDRVGSDDLRMTHEYLAVMLGARRASVTEALRPLQEAELLRSSRGRITILDAPGLEARACECYGVVRDRYDELLGGSEAGRQTASRRSGKREKSR